MHTFVHKLNYVPGLDIPSFKAAYVMTLCCLKMFHSFHRLMNSINWPACHCMGLHSLDGRAL